MKKIIPVVLALVFAIFAASCGDEPELGYEDFDSYVTSFSDSLYSADLAVLAYKPEAGERFTKPDGGEYVRYSLPLAEVIRGDGHLESVTLEERWSPDGTLVETMKEDTPYLVLCNKLGENYIIYSEFCLTELNEELEAVDGNRVCPCHSIEDAKRIYNEELAGIEKYINARAIKKMKEGLEIYGSVYHADMNYQIFSFDWQLQYCINERDPVGEIYESYYRTSHFLNDKTDERRKEINSDCAVVFYNANNYSFGDFGFTAVLDCKDQTIYGYLYEV